MRKNKEELIEQIRSSKLSLRQHQNRIVAYQLLIEDMQHDTSKLETQIKQMENML